MNELLNAKINKFINYCLVEEKSQNTIEKYQRDIRDFILWLEKEELKVENIKDLNKEIFIGTSVCRLLQNLFCKKETNRGSNWAPRIT